MSPQFNVAWVFAAMYSSEMWSERRAELTRSRDPLDMRAALHARARAVVVHDRVLNWRTE